MAYIETVGKFVLCRRDLIAADLGLIGEFTRENISRWLDKGYWFEMGVYGYEDFHAVCGDIDIPWTTEEGRYAESAQEADKRWMEQNAAKNREWMLGQPTKPAV